MHSFDVEEVLPPSVVPEATIAIEARSTESLVIFGGAFVSINCTLPLASENRVHCSTKSAPRGRFKDLEHMACRSSLVILQVVASLAGDIPIASRYVLSREQAHPIKMSIVDNGKVLETKFDPWKTAAWNGTV